MKSGRSRPGALVGFGAPMSDRDLLHDLNDEQREAVLHDRGPLLILAGAGSGKTRVITRRVAHLILARHVDPQRIVAITFTNKAAREMKERVSGHVPRNDLWVSTFHAMAARILRREAPAIGFRNDFTIYDTYDRSQALRGVVKDLSLDEELYKPGVVGHQISSRKNRGIAPGAVDPQIEHIDPVFAKIEVAYAEKLKKCEAMDFDDLLLNLLKLLEDAPGVGERYARRFEHVLVDEYQDTNHLQYRITRALASGHQNLCVCGDPDQSIYAWRGADIHNILNFEKDFSPVKVVRLEMNYRSMRNILSAAQAVIEQNTQRKAKVLKTEAPEGARIGMVEALDELDEARAIVNRIRGLVGDSKALRADGDRFRFSDMAIFYRANFLQRSLERALRDATVPYRIAAGLEFFERREIKDLIAYLRLIVNLRDDISFERIINVPTRGIGAASLEKLKEIANLENLGLMEAASRGDVRGRFPARARNAIHGFVEMIGKLALRARGPGEDLLEAVLDATQYLQYCGDLGDSGDMDRVENVKELVASAREYDGREPGGGIAGFLNEVALVSDTDRLNEDSNYVTLMTLHSAKGLEFPVVFIAGVEDGLIPHRRAVEERNNQDGLEEERRLFYVGITRARERLVLTRARYRTQFGPRGTLFGMETAPSRFLDEIPGELLDEGFQEGFASRRDIFDDQTFESRHGSDDDHSQVGSTGSAGHPQPLFPTRARGAQPAAKQGDLRSARSVSKEVSAQPRDLFQPAGPPPGSAAPPAVGFKPGTRVRHAQFGDGHILELRGTGVNARVVVLFPGVGEKQLLLQYARLDRIG